MFWIIILFIVFVALPLWTQIRLLDGDLPARLELGTLVALVVLVLLLLWHRRHERAQVARPPAPPARTRVVALKWPRNLDPAQFEAHCAAYLREHGWQVVPARSTLADDVYLDATGPDAHALILCDRRAELLAPVTMRSLAVIAGTFSGACPVVLTDGAVPSPTVQMAAREGVALLQVADLPRLAELSRRAPQQAAAGPTPPPP